MVLCVTRFNNQTLYELYCYNYNIAIDDDAKHHYELFRNWVAYKIPSIEDRIEEEKRNIARCDSKYTIVVKRKKIASMKKDIHLLKTCISDYFSTCIANIPYDVMNHKKNWIYNVPITMHPSINQRKVVVLEMNNSTNEITGVCLLQNKCYHRRYKVYRDSNYNRYSYSGKRFPSSYNNRLHNIIKKIEPILFTGSTHQKRGQGIQKIASGNIEVINNVNIENSNFPSIEDELISILEAILE